MSERELQTAESVDRADEVEQAVQDVRSPSVQELAGLVGGDRTPDVAAVVAVFRQYPADRNALMATVHRLLGNSAAAEIAAALAPAAAVEGAALDEAAGREPVVEIVAEADGSVSVAPVAETGVTEQAPVSVDVTAPATETVIQTDVAATEAGKEMRAGGIAAVTEAPEVEQRLGDAMTETMQVPPEPASGQIEVGATPLQVSATEQVVLEAAAMVDRDAELDPYAPVDTFRQHLDELPLSSEARTQVLGAYAEMSAGVAAQQVIEAPIEDEIRDPI